MLHTAKGSGIDTALPAAVLGHFRRGMAAGYGADSFTSLLEVIKKSA